MRREQKEEEGKKKSHSQIIPLMLVVIAHCHPSKPLVAGVRHCSFSLFGLIKAQYEHPGYGGSNVQK